MVSMRKFNFSLIRHNRARFKVFSLMKWKEALGKKKDAVIGCCGLVRTRENDKNQIEIEPRA